MTRFDEERALPPIFTTAEQRESGEWPEPFYPDRIDWYTRLVVDSGVILGGRDVIPEFIAAMICESSLDNLNLGNNAKNGSDNPTIGVSWVQLDTGYHVGNLDLMHAYREDPLQPLLYVARTPDLCRHGRLRSHFTRRRWHAWTQEKIDPTDGWSPLAAALEAWDRVVG